MIAGLSGLRLGGIIAVVLGLAAAAWWLVATVRDRDRLQALDTRHIACVADIKAKAAESVIDRDCDQVLADAATLAARAADCDADLAANNAYGIGQACSAEVKRRDAMVTALGATNANLVDQLAQSRAETVAAASRAAARTTLLNRKDADAKAALKAAPRGADGRIHCDDQCLRDLAGD